MKNEKGKMRNELAQHDASAISHFSFSISHLLQAVFPATCVACGRVLTVGEKHLCLHCLSALKSIGYADFSTNPAEQQLTGLPNLVAASAMLNYRKDSTVQKVVHDMKFHGNSNLCLMMGRLLGLDLMRGGRFDDVDLLVPVPLHWLRRISRGYNQSMLLCQGMARVMKRPIVEGCLVRHRYTRKQSQQRSAGRSRNVEGAFTVRHPDRLANKHILLVDDVLTTGATLAACADALSKVPGIKLSVATLSMAD